MNNSTFRLQSLIEVMYTYKMLIKNDLENLNLLDEKFYKVREDKDGIIKDEDISEEDNKRRKVRR